MPSIKTKIGKNIERERLLLRIYKADGDYRSQLNFRKRSRQEHLLPLQEWQELSQAYTIPSRPLSDPSSVKLQDFTLSKTIGQGGFGRIVLAQRKTNQKYIALKIMNKKKVVEWDCVQCVIDERIILSSIKFPFIINLQEHFKDSTNLYLVMDFLPGGDLQHLQEIMGKLPIELSRFYGAQLVLAIEYLHSLNIVHRDIKPENVLIGKNGYIKLTDFGFAYQQTSKPMNINCGTMDYKAPEVHLGKNYNQSIDWWSFGVLMFLICSGKFPFCAKSPKKIVIKAYRGNIKFPTYFPVELKNLTTKLLQVNVSKRLGSSEKGAVDIRNHPFFDSVNFHDILCKSVAPPFTPNCSTDDMFENFWKIEKEEMEISENFLYEKEFSEF